MESNQDQILLIEDSAEDAELLCRAFRALQRPITCAVVADVSSAQNYVREHPDLSLIVVEDRLTGEPGRRFLEWMRSQSNFDSIPVAVFATGPTDPRPWRRAGAQAIVEKPFSYEEFVTMAKVLKPLAEQGHLSKASGF